MEIGYIIGVGGDKEYNNRYMWVVLNFFNII